MKKNVFTVLQIVLTLLSITAIDRNIASAQISADDTVDTVVDRDSGSTEITGGKTQGNNLFHSFQEFSVPTGNEAFFNNADNISNIFGRVTGGNISDIDGAIRANGSANLFLINPAGIIFGEDASLNLGGSFYASTASGILFEDGEFSAIDNLEEPILSINAPIGLNFRNDGGNADIVNRSLNSGNGLGVATGENIALVGGDVELNGGLIFAPSGRVELGGLSAAGEIGINSDGSLDFTEVKETANVSLSNSSRASATTFPGTPNSTENSGNINIYARNLSLTEGSTIDASTLGEGNAEGTAGTISINILDTVSINQSTIENQLGQDTVNNAGGINITTNNLSLGKVGVITSSTGGKGNGGAISIKASTISIEGQTGDDNSSGIFNQVFKGAAGNAGKIEIYTTNLSLGDGGVITSSTGGQGNGGAISINPIDASMSISADNSGIFSQVLGGATGNAGEINISTTNLSLTNGGVVTASTGGIGDAGAIAINVSDTISAEGQTEDGFDNSGIFSQVFEEVEGNGGEINLVTTNLSLSDGGQVDASTLGSGNAGNVTVKATKAIAIDNVSKNEDFPVRSGLYANALLNSGNGGNVNVITERLTISNGATIDVGNFDDLENFEPGTGQPGNINIEANLIELNNEARIVANKIAEAGDSGNINIEAEDRAILQENSFISAQAFNNADGGNLTIDTSFIVAFPNISPGNGNDLIASAEKGSGGSIEITAKSLLGIREGTAIASNGTNDIDASSQFGLNGNISISTSDVNVIQSNFELTKGLFREEQTVTEVCRSSFDRGSSSSFSIKGKGGTMPAPDSPLDSRNLLIDNASVNNASTTDRPIQTSRGKIQPARGIKVIKSGEIILTAYRTDNAGDRPMEIYPNCDRNKVSISEMSGRI